MIQEAQFYNKLPDGNVGCFICGQKCVISDGLNGKCGIRTNIAGKLEIQNYGRINSTKIISIPGYYFQNQKGLAIGTIGNSMKGTYNSNWDLAHFREIYSKEYGREWVDRNLQNFGEIFSAKDIIEYCKTKSINNLYFTFSEPIVNLEYYYKIMEIARENNIKSIWDTNGYFTEESLEIAIEKIDGVHFQLDSLNRDFYIKHHKAKIQTILEYFEKIAAINGNNNGKKLEVVYTLITGENDTDKEIIKLANYIKQINPEIPLNFKKFIPDHRMQDKEITSDNQICRTILLAKDSGLKNVIEFIA
jgi:pyruvate formate lyase activating enzyme